MTKMHVFLSVPVDHQVRNQHAKKVQLLYTQYINHPHAEESRVFNMYHRSSGLAGKNMPVPRPEQSNKDTNAALEVPGAYSRGNKIRC
jgi:hypothetical protein